MAAIRTVMFVIFCAQYVSSGCRHQEQNACESLCRYDVDGKLDCELRIAVILPNLPSIEASLMRVSSKDSRNEFRRNFLFVIIRQPSGIIGESEHGYFSVEFA